MALQPYDGEIQPLDDGGSLTPYSGELKPLDYSPPKPSSLARRAIGDTAVSLGKGIIGAGEAAVGLADLATGGAAGKALEGVGYRPKQTKEFLDEFYSPEQKVANQRVQEAEGFFGTAGAMLENPSTIAHTAVESVPSMLGGGAIARGLGGATKLGAVARGAIGEGAVGAGSAAEQVRQQTDDGLLTAEQTAASLASGIGTGLLGAAGGRVAQRLGIGDVDTALAGGALQTSAKGRARRFAEGALSEGVLEELPQSAQEQVWQNAALGRPLGEGAPEAAATGLLTGAAMGGGVAAIPGRARPERERPSPADDWVGALERAHGGEPDSAARYNRLREQDKDLRDFLQYSEPWLSDEGERSDRDEKIQREVDIFQSPQTSPEQRLEAMQNIYGTLDDEISDFIASREAPDPEVLERELAAAGVSPPAPAPVIDERRMAAALDFGIDPAAGPLSKAATEALALPAPVRAGTPDEQLLLGELQREEEVAAAERRTRQIYSDREAFERVRTRTMKAEERRAPVPRLRDQVGSPQGEFSAVGDFADLLGQERQDIEQRRSQIANRQALRREVELSDADHRVADARQREAAQRRRAVLDAVLSDPETADPARRFTAMLEQLGYRNAAVTADELRTIQRFEDVRNAQPAGPEIEPSAPNELDPAAWGIRERRPRILSTTPHRGVAMARVAQARRQNPSANFDMVEQGDGWAVIERPEPESPQLPGATNGAIPADPPNAAMAAPSGAQGGADLARGAGAAVSQPDVSALGGVEPVAAGAVAGQQPTVSAGNASGGRPAVDPASPGGQALRMLIDRTGGLGTPDALAGPENQAARAEIVSMLRGVPAEQLSFGEKSVGALQVVLHRALGLDGPMRERQARLVEMVDELTGQAAPAEAPQFSRARAPNRAEAANIARGNEAMARVITEQTDVQDAMYRPDHGYVSFVWGKVGNPSKGFAGGHGISKIIAKRTAEGADGEAVARKMVEVIALGAAGETYGPAGGERFNVSYDGHTAVLSLRRFGNRETWLLTGWDDVASDGAKAGNAAGAYAPEPSGIRAQVGADSGSSLANPESDGTPNVPRSSAASAQRGGITASRLSQVFAERFPKLAPAFRTMVERGMRREKGGVVMVNDATPQGMAQTFARSTGRRVDEVVQYFRSEETGDIQGFYDPRSGLTFLVAPNLNDQTAPAVLLHEMIHSQQREKLDARAMAMLNGRASAAPKERAFLDRVARRMADAGETGNPREATSYIVEQAVLEGRDAGYTAADGKLADWIEAIIGKPVANLVRGFMMMVRGWIVRSGLPANTPVTVDDLVSYAMAGMERAARGDVRTSGAGRATSQKESPQGTPVSGADATRASERSGQSGAGGAFNVPREIMSLKEADIESRGGDPLAHAEMPRQASTFEEARAAAKAFQGQPLTNRASGMAVTVSRNNLDKMLSQSAVGKSTSAFDQSLAVANLDHLFNNAVFGWTKPDRDSDPNIVGVHRFFAPMDTANGTRVVKLTVKESARQDQGSKIYTVESLEIESPASIWVDSTVQADGLDPTSTPYAGLIQSLVETVQQRNARRDGRPQFSRAATATPPLGDQVRAAANRITGRRPTDPSDPFATENVRLREQDKTLWDKAKKLLRRQLAPGGLLPDSVFAGKIARDSEFQAVEFDVRHIVGGLERAVRADYGVTFDKLTDEQQRELSTALAGKMPTGLPEATKTAILAMRQYIDKLSTDYLHIVQGKIDALMEKAQASGRDGDKAQAINEIELYEKIKGNIGQYVHRSYQAFDDPKWFQKVPTGAVNAARQYLKLGYMEDGKTSEAEALRLAEVTLHEILKNGTAYDSMESFIAESKLGAKDLSVLMRRKEVPIQIRALLGEYTDPRLNFAKSATKMGRLIWNQRFLERVREVGAGAFLFDGKDRPPEATAQLAADGSEVMAPLNGLWTYPEVAQAFKDALGKEQMSGLYRAVVRANGFVKYGKTVLSPTTAMRNWQSAMFFALANGHFDLTQMKKSVAAFREQVRQNATGDDLAYLRHLKQLGVVYDTPAAGEMMRLLDDAKVEDLLSGRSGKAVDFVRKANQMAQGFYSFGDDFWKIIGFENEKANLQKAGMPLAEAEREAAKRIRDMYPTYSMVGRGVQWLSRFPLAGTFVSLPAEIVRTTGNMLRTTAADLKSDNPGMRQIGIKRAVGMALVSGMFWALSAATKAMFDVDDDEEEALRDLAPEWQKNSTFLYAGRDDKGNLRYFDMSFLDPYGYWKRPVTAMLRNQPWEKSAASALSDMVTPFLGADITADAIFQALANKKPTGGRVYQENDTPVNQAVDIANHLRKTLQPGFMGNIERFALAAQDVKREGSGQPYSLQDEMVALLGWRASTMDPKTALYYRSFEFTDAMSEARQALTRTLRSVNEVSSEDIAESRERARRKQVEAFTEMHRLVQAARQAGMTHAEIIQTLRLSNISQGNVSALMRGVPPPLVVGAAATRNAVQQARGMQGPEFASEVARRFKEAAAG